MFKLIIYEKKGVNYIFRLISEMILDMKLKFEGYITRQAMRVLK